MKLITTSDLFIKKLREKNVEYVELSVQLDLKKAF